MAVVALPPILAGLSLLRLGCLVVVVRGSDVVGTVEEKMSSSLSSSSSSKFSEYSSAVISPPLSFGSSSSTDKSPMIFVDSVVVLGRVVVVEVVFFLLRSFCQKGTYFGCPSFSDVGGPIEPAFEFKDVGSCRDDTANRSQIVCLLVI